MSNDSVLRKGARKAAEIIDRHIVNNILVPASRELIREAIEGRVTLGHNMTGNTVNSYAVGVFSKGALVCIETPEGQIPGPLRRKLNAGERFRAGDQRWDGDLQQKTFKGKVSTNGTTESERNIAFINSYKAISKGWELVVCNGVEYALYQEAEMGIDVLTKHYNNTRMFADSLMFKPMTA